MLKKILLPLFIVFFSAFTFASAVESDPYAITWKYVFHLEEKGGILGINSDEKDAYDSIPMGFDGGAVDGEYYGEIVSGRGISLAKVWFNAPSLFVAAQNKKIADIDAPSFANADHVTFYTKGGVSLFSISLRGSSFCNDDGKCNDDVGETYLNCANDCVAPPAPLAPTITETPILEPATQPVVLPVTPDTSTATSEDVIIERTPGVATGMLSTTVSLTIGVFLILIAIVGILYIRHKKKSLS